VPAIRLAQAICGSRFRAPRGGKVRGAL